MSLPLALERSLRDVDAAVEGEPRPAAPPGRSPSLGASAAGTANPNVDVSQGAATTPMRATEGAAGAADATEGSSVDSGALVARPPKVKGKAEKRAAVKGSVNKVSAVPPTHVCGCMPSVVWDTGHAHAYVPVFPHACSVCPNTDVLCDQRTAHLLRSG